MSTLFQAKQNKQQAASQETSLTLSGYLTLHGASQAESTRGRPFLKSQQRES